ncbi:MAG: HAD family hydrolase [Proteobacteria bacterium]|nr:HAD family hydrolase [Pseudomonadota bacterium]
MPAHPALIVFDLDGTLVDSRLDIANALNVSLAQFNQEPVAEESLFPLIGLPLCEIFKRLLSAENQSHIEEICQYYRDYYYDHCTVHTRPYSGVLECLDTLAHFGVRLAICTGKMRFQAVRVLSQLQLLHRFECIVGSDSLPYKPDPAGLLLILREMAVLPQRAWMVGDTSFDIQAGKGAGMRTCALTYGAHSLSELENTSPDLLLDNLFYFPQYIGLAPSLPTNDENSPVS